MVANVDAKRERAYRLLIETSDAVRRARSEAELTEDVCRIAVDLAGYRLAWVGYRREYPPYEVVPVAHAAQADAAGYLAELRIALGDPARREGPTGRAMRLGQPQVAQNLATDPQFEPWRASALAHGFASSAAFPLTDDRGMVGALNLYASEPDAFDADELALLGRVASTLELGIRCARGQCNLSALQARLARFEHLSAVVQSAAMLAHDVNNHLAVVAICLGELDHVTGDERTKLVHDANLSVERAIALNRRLASVARRGPPTISVFAVDEMLAGLHGELRWLIGKSANLVIETGAPGATVAMDQAELGQVLTNLVANARDAIGARGTITVRTSTLRLERPLPARWVGAEPGEFVVVRVSDDGAGIRPEHLERLFTPFFTTKTTGTGLGLASTWAIVRQAGGFIAVDSAPGDGATFEVILPLRSSV